MNIIESLLAYLRREHKWFTTKNDPLFQEPNHYYELDEFGDPTEQTCKQIEKEVNSYVGDGAVTVEDALDIWVEEATRDGRIWYKDGLVTKFKPKRVVAGLDAFENSVQLAEAYHPDIDRSKIKMGVCPYCGSRNLEYDNNGHCTVDEYNDYVSYSWQCQDCKEEGNEVFGLEFLGQEIYNDPDDESSGTSLILKENKKKLKQKASKQD